MNIKQKTNNTTNEFRYFHESNFVGVNRLFVLVYTNHGCLLDFDYIKNHYRLIALDLSKQKELDADPKAI